MELLLTMDKIIKMVKSICIYDELGVTYSELLVLVSIDKGYYSLRGICRFLLTDKGCTYRILESLLKKNMILKMGKLHRAEYFLKEEGIGVLNKAQAIKDFIVEEDFGDVPKEFQNGVKDVLKYYEEKLVKRYFYT